VDHLDNEPPASADIRLQGDILMDGASVVPDQYYNQGNGLDGPVEAELSRQEQLEEAIGALLITNLRLYDVLLSLLTGAYPELAKNLMQTHLEGKLVGPPPLFGGEFLTETENP
jgi:hypothetical protein